MDASMKAATPGEHHKRLAARAGEWEGTGTMWMDPSTPLRDPKAKIQRTMILGGRLMVEEYAGGPGMGRPYVGPAHYAYETGRTTGAGRGAPKVHSEGKAGRGRWGRRGRLPSHPERGALRQG